MRKFTLLVLFALQPLLSHAWGREGHQIIAGIAEDLLSPNAKKNLQLCLGATTIGQASTWMDEQRGDHDYDHMKPWHYINIEKGRQYDPASEDNIIWALNKVFGELQHREKLSIEQARTDAMVLIHLMGDLQQPLHVGYGSDKGGNTLQVQFGGKGTNLHHVWDSDIIGSEGITKASVMKTGTSITSADMEHLPVKAGDFVTYMNENRALLDGIYNFNGHKLPDDYGSKNKSMVESQLRNGGIRLAAVLDYLFRKDVAYQKSAQEKPAVKDSPSVGIKVVYTPDEAVRHIGEEATVCGKVYGVKHVTKGSGPTFINMGAAYPENPFTAVIFGDDRKDFSYRPEDALDGRTICVTGRVKEYKGKTEIIVNTEAQINVQ